jgi:hypothetical protein
LRTVDPLAGRRANAVIPLGAAILVFNALGAQNIAVALEPEHGRRHTC